ncbi:MAG: response regulator transcription factor [Bacteroidales bacterium]|nr:response regulator transcription factor [Bacteroidales bacterium]
MINLLVADDHEIFIDGLKIALNDVPDINIKNTVKNGIEVLNELEYAEYDIVLLDVNMPEMDGVDCARKLCKMNTGTKVLILSQFGDKKLVDKLLKYDIDGYLLKSSTKEEIIKAIRDVNNNIKYFSEEIKSEISHKNTITSRYDYYKCKFSKRETQILNLICQGLINSEIANELNLSQHSVETFRQRIMMKSGMRNTAELVKWAIENDIIE